MSSERPKRKNKQYSAASMLAAIDCVTKNGFKPSEAAKIHFVPYTTLRDRLSGVHEGKVGAKTTLKDEEELALVDWIKSWARMGQPLESSQVLKAAGRIARNHANGEKQFDNGGMILMMI